MTTYWPNDIGKGGDTIPVQPAEAATDLGADQDDGLNAARSVVYAVVIVSACLVTALMLAAVLR